MKKIKALFTPFNNNIIIISSITIILISVFCGAYLSSQSSSQGESSVQTKHYSSNKEVRCWYCGKVIINSDGRYIHCTPIYNGGVVKCEYCNTKNSID